MKTILAVNLAQLLRFKRALLYVLFSVGITVVVFWTASFLWSQAYLVGRHTDFVGFFHQLNFYWLLGIPLLLFIFVFGIGLIADEKNRGTLFFLFSKPIARSRILLGKWLALVFSSFILGMGTIILALCLTSYFLIPDYIRLYQLFLLLPFMALYLIFLSMVFSALAMAVSVFIRTKGNAAWIFAVILLAVYVLIPSLKGIFPSRTALPVFFNWIDLTGHLQQVYFYLLTLQGAVPVADFFHDSALIHPLIVIGTGLILAILLLIWAAGKLGKTDIFDSDIVRSEQL